MAITAEELEWLAYCRTVQHTKLFPRMKKTLSFSPPKPLPAPLITEPLSISIGTLLAIREREKRR